MSTRTLIRSLSGYSGTSLMRKESALSIFLDRIAFDAKYPTDLLICPLRCLKFLSAQLADLR
jgi:hypothetical protein